MTMTNYTDQERNVLAELGRANFKNLGKSDVLSLVSKIDQMRPEVAKAALEQYPEFVNAVKDLMVQYKDSITTVMESDDKSLEHVYQIIQSEHSLADKGRDDWFSLARDVRADIGKCLDNPNLSEDERREMLDREMKIVEMADKKDNDVRESISKATDKAVEKDSEKRKFDWGVLTQAASVVIMIAGIGALILGGGDFNIKLPGGSNKA